MRDAAFLGLAEAARLIETRQLSPVELVEDQLERIEALDPQINAYITVTAELALEQAREAEREIAAGGYRGPLHGIPIALKDVIETAGIRTTAHSRVLKDNIPRRDATVYRKLRENGAILLGKTATHEFAHGGPSFDLPWPPARNPWSTERFTGGSSSGSAAAVAADLATAAIGTDTGGSIRIPAALCGVTGFKPTYGLVSRAGIVPNSYTFDHCGPIAWTAEDCAHVVQAIAGYDREDPASALVESPDYAAALTGDLRGVRIGVVRHFWEEDLPVSPVVASALESVCGVLRELGAQLETVRVRPLHEYTDVKNLISGVELHAAHQRLLAAHTAEFGAIMRQRILGFCALRAVDYVRAERQRQRLVREMQPIFEEYDLLLTAAPGPAPPLAQHRALGLDDKREKPKFTAFASVSGGPALVACCGFDADRLPLAFEISGAPFQDAVLLRAGHAYQQVTGMPSTRPHLDHRAAPRAIAAADEPTPGAIEEPLAMHLDRLAERAGFRFTASQRAEFHESAVHALALAERVAALEAHGSKGGSC